MRRTPPIVWLVAVTILVGIPCVATAAAQSCWWDVNVGELRCQESGGGTTSPTTPRGALIYLYTTTRPPVGECYYWSRIPGGLDSSQSANDAAIIEIVLRLPRCPVATVVDAEATAWAIFRSWDLDPPAPTMQPSGAGITGMPAHLSTPTPDIIEHQEVLPDGRTLRVRAEVAQLTVRWGDGTQQSFEPSAATPYPTGTVSHEYTLKTCSASYRSSHPSGRLCHPSLEAYPVRAVFVWAGRYNAGSGWIDLGTLDRAVTIQYDVDEARGVNVP